jgi:hypothetical protein
MQNLLAKLQDAVQHAQGITSEYRQKLSALQIRESAVENRAANLASLEADLQRRIGSVEIHENIKAVQDKNASKESDLVKEREQLDSDKAYFKQKLDEQKQLIEGEKVQIAEQWKMIEAAKKNVEADMYRKMEELLKNKK